MNSSIKNSNSVRGLLSVDFTFCVCLFHHRSQTVLQFLEAGNALRFISYRHNYLAKREANLIDFQKEIWQSTLHQNQKRTITVWETFILSIIFSDIICQCVRVFKISFVI